MDPKSFGIDVDNDFKPKYVIMPCADVVKNLKSGSIDRHNICGRHDYYYCLAYSKCSKILCKKR